MFLLTQSLMPVIVLPLMICFPINNLLKSRFQMQFCLFYVINIMIVLILRQVFRVFLVKIGTLGVMLIRQRQVRYLFQVKKIMSTTRFLIGLRPTTMDLCRLYASLCVPDRGSTIKFYPLEYLHPLEFHRPDETILHIAGATVDLMSCSTSFELAEAQKALAVEEEATALSVWAISSICGSLRLEHILTILAGALLEKQIVFVCSNLGILSASVLSIIPLIRPYQWQSFFMPVLPNDMLDFLDAPVPFIVGEVQSKSGNVILVDANKNQVKSLSIPHFPQYKELYAALTPYHAQLVGETYLGKRRPVYDCTNVQVEAAKGFLRVLRSYLDSFCSNLRLHKITNVQLNDDKVSLLLKESFIESFPSRDRPFMNVIILLL